MDMLVQMVQTYCTTRSGTGGRPWYRNLFAQILLVSSVRSEDLQKLFTHTLIDLSSPACATPLYEYCLDNNCILPGRKKNRHYKQLTTEQKLWDIGKLISYILVPFWRNPTVFDGIIFGQVQLLGHIPLFKGALVFTHTCAFLVEIARRTGLFPEMDSYFESAPGKNSAHFLDICSAVSERGCPIRPTYVKIAEHVTDELGLEGDDKFSADSVCGFACKFIQLIAGLFTGATLGRERNERTKTQGVKQLHLKQKKGKGQKRVPRARLKLQEKKRARQKP